MGETKEGVGVEWNVPKNRREKNEDSMPVLAKRCTGILWLVALLSLTMCFPITPDTCEGCIFGAIPHWEKKQPLLAKKSEASAARGRGGRNNLIHVLLEFSFFIDLMLV